MKTKTNTSHRRVAPQEPVLRFSPTAWAKLLFFRDRGETEIGGFAISDPNDLLYVHDFLTVKQNVDVASVSFDNNAVADYFEDQVDLGRMPEQFSRIWLHTHPGGSPTPSSTDEATFHRVFGKCDWAVLFIIAQEGKIYARLRFNTGPGGQLLIPVQVDYTRPFDGADIPAWEAEYQTHIQTPKISRHKKHSIVAEDLEDYDLPADMVEQLEMMDPAERQTILEELACRPDLWDDEEMEAALW